MKPTLLFAALSMALASPSVFAKTELETLRARCSEQERQIRMLEEDNAKLRNVPSARHASATKNEVVSNSTVKPVTTAKAVAGDSHASTYTVKAGDSFAKISRKVGMSPEKLAKSNGLKMTSVIRPGQKLKITGKAPASAPAKAVGTSDPANTVKNGTGTHTVRPGDTYSSISKKHGVSTAALIAANPKVKPSALRPGQTVNLGGTSSTMTVSTPIAHAKAPARKASAPAPVSKEPARHETIPVSTTAPTVTRQHTAAASPAPSPAQAPAVEAPAQTPASQTAAAAAPSPTTEKKIRPVLIEGEMTYGEFAAKHGTDAGRLNALNGLDLTTATVLAKGSELYVPAQP